jgi:hypothetical protein
MAEQSRADILVVRQLGRGMAGADTIRVISRHASGPRGWRNAVKSYWEDCRTAAARYGNLGCGSGWIEVVAHGNGPGTGIDVGEISAPGVDYAATIDFDYDVRPPVGAGFEWWQDLAGVSGLPSLDPVTKGVRQWTGETWSTRGPKLGARSGTWCDVYGSHCLISGVCASCGLSTR